MMWVLRLIPATAILLGVLATPAVAALLCEKKSGAIFVRPSACKKKETTVNPAALGLQGPPGAKGDVGAPGTPGAPGSALAYAHVNADGTVDAANSKNVANANVSLDTSVLPSAFCFHDLGFSFHSVVAMAAWGGLATSGGIAQAAVGDPAGDCSTAAEAVVVTQNGSGLIPLGFYVVFN
jgi:hypothetical protein